MSVVMDRVEIPPSIRQHPCRQARIQWNCAMECPHRLRIEGNICAECQSSTEQRDAMRFYKDMEGVEY